MFALLYLVPESRGVQFRQMLIESPIAGGDELLVESPLISATFVTADEQNRLPPRIECERNTPDPASPTEAQFLHVSVLRCFEGIYRRPPQGRAELPQQQGMGKHFILHVFAQGLELGVKLVVKDYGPSYWHIMYSKAYVVKIIYP
jgi:hypothetical protein